MKDLKSHLLSSEKDRFGRVLGEKIRVYAAGPSLEFTDEQTGEELARGFKKAATTCAIC